MIGGKNGAGNKNPTKLHLSFCRHRGLYSSLRRRTSFSFNFHIIPPRVSSGRNGKSGKILLWYRSYHMIQSSFWKYQGGGHHVKFMTQSFASDACRSYHTVRLNLTPQTAYIKHDLDFRFQSYDNHSAQPGSTAGTAVSECSPILRLNFPWMRSAVSTSKVNELEQDFRENTAKNTLDQQNVTAKLYESTCWSILRTGMAREVALHTSPRVYRLVRREYRTAPKHT